MSINIPRVEGTSDRVGLAIIVVVFNVLALSLGDAIIKKISTDFVLWQIFVIRSALAIPALIILMRYPLTDVPIMPDKPGWAVGFALIWGYLFFSEIPDLISVSGMLMIVLAGIISVRQ